MNICVNDFYLQYTWNANDIYLFKSTMAFAMRQYYLKEKKTDVNFT